MSVVQTLKAAISTTQTVEAPVVEAVVILRDENGRLQIHPSTPDIQGILKVLNDAAKLCRKQMH